MEPREYVLLYSKYSQHCKRLMGKIENAPVDLIDAMGLIPVSVDNERIHDRILADSVADVSVVPTILAVYADGGVDKFEGNQAFGWVESAVRARMPNQQLPSNSRGNFTSYAEPIDGPTQEVQQPMQQPPQQPMPPPMQHPVPSQQPMQQPVQQTVQQPAQQSLQQPVQQPVPQPQPVQSVPQQPLQPMQVAGGTPIGELIDDGLPERPPASIRTGANGYDQLQLPQSDALNHQDTTHAIRGSSSMSLAEKAALMQQGREADEMKHPRAVTPMST